MSKKEKMARIIRVVTVPPVLVSLLIFILYFSRFYIFKNNVDFILAFILLGIFPVIGYPLQRLLPGLKYKGRDGQRKLAFIMNIIGYTLLLIIGYVRGITADLQFIYLTYFISIIILSFFNKIIHVKASGHACSAVAPLLFLIYFVVRWSIIPSFVIYSLSFWASLVLKRHKLNEFIMGSITCLISFFIAHLFVFTI